MLRPTCLVYQNKNGHQELCLCADLFCLILSAEALTTVDFVLFAYCGVTSAATLRRHVKQQTGATTCRNGFMQQRYHEEISIHVSKSEQSITGFRIINASNAVCLCMTEGSGWEIKKRQRQRGRETTRLCSVIGSLSLQRRGGQRSRCLEGPPSV